jgi:AcrR family transcriptional regulator
MMAQAKTYHKEDLRRDLLAAGRELIAQQGYHALSLRGLAQKVGVTSGAPYHHFADRRALLLAIAIEGFEDLIAPTQAPEILGLPPLDRLIALGQAYLDFAQHQPRLMQLMYESELATPALAPELLVYQRQGSQALLDAVTQALPATPLNDRISRVVGYWSTVYGLAVLRHKGLIQPHEPEAVAPQDTDHLVIARSARAALQA